MGVQIEEGGGQVEVGRARQCRAPWRDLERSSSPRPYEEGDSDVGWAGYWAWVGQKMAQLGQGALL